MGAKSRSKNRSNITLLLVIIGCSVAAAILAILIYGYGGRARQWTSKMARVKPSEVRSVAARQPRKNPTVAVHGSKVGKDGAEMVLIPAGEFQMGSDDGDTNEKPVHNVFVDAFYMDKYEVSNTQYLLFVQETGHKEPEGCAYVGGRLQTYFRPWSDEKFSGPNQPVVCVTWADAMAYAQWAGKRLPTEAEWEKAARGGLVDRKFPLGDELNRDDANSLGIGEVDIWECPAPVDSFAPNGYGLHNMSGNVWEWCSDWYSETYYSSSAERNPKGPGSGVYRVFRGGSWINPFNYFLRVSVRNFTNPPIGGYSLGFRCVESVSN